MLGNTGAWLTYISTEDRLELYRHLNQEVPLLATPALLGLSEHELSDFIRSELARGHHPFHAFDSSDIIACAQHGLVDPALEAFAAALRENPWDYWPVGALLDNLEQVLEQFPAERRGDLVAAITREAPLFWARRLDFMLQHEIMTLPELVDKLEQAPRFGMAAAALVNGVRALEKRGWEPKPEPSSAQILQRVRERITDDPALYLETCHTDGFIYPGDPVPMLERRLADTLQKPNRDILAEISAGGSPGRFLENLLWEIGCGRFTELIEPVRELCQRSPKVVQTMLGMCGYSPIVWDGVRQLLPLSERLECLVSLDPERVSWQALLGRDRELHPWVAEELVQSTAHLNVVVARLNSAQHRALAPRARELFSSLLKQPPDGEPWDSEECREEAEWAVAALSGESALAAYRAKVLKKG
jgi:hypothetical protein